MNPAGLTEGGERIEGCGCAQPGFAAAMDQLMDLREEFYFADAAAPPLQIIAGPEALALGIMIADPAADRLDLTHRAEIERASPHERMNRIQKIVGEPAVPTNGACADEGGALPGQCRGFIITDRRIHRQCDGRDFR